MKLYSCMGLRHEISHFLFQTEVNFGKDIADNGWHFVVFTVDVNEVQFYVDGDPVGNAQ